MEEQTLFETRRFRLVRRTYRDSNGAEHARESVQHVGAVGIVPITADGRVCLVRNHRIAVGKTLLEIPAGTMEAGESPLETARRELEEETGYRAGRLEPLFQMYMSPGILNEQLHIFLATDLTPGAMNLDAGEEIETFETTWEEAIAMIRDGRIEDAKSIAGLLFCDRLREQASR